MKIIGNVGDQEYIVEISEEEIAICMGFRSAYDDGYNAAKRVGANRDGTLKIGVVVNVSGKADAVNQLARNEATALAGAEALEALAKMMRGAMPSRFFTPPPEPKADEAAS